MHAELQELQVGIEKTKFGCDSHMQSSQMLL